MHKCYKCGGNVQSWLVVSVREVKNTPDGPVIMKNRHRYCPECGNTEKIRVLKLEKEFREKQQAAEPHIYRVEFNGEVSTMGRIGLAELLGPVPYVVRITISRAMGSDDWQRQLLAISLSYGTPEGIATLTVSHIPDTVPGKKGAW